MPSVKPSSEQHALAAERTARTVIHGVTMTREQVLDGVVRRVQTEVHKLRGPWTSAIHDTLMATLAARSTPLPYALYDLPADASAKQYLAFLDDLGVLPSPLTTSFATFFTEERSELVEPATVTTTAYTLSQTYEHIFGDSLEMARLFPFLEGQPLYRVRMFSGGAAFPAYQLALAGAIGILPPALVSG